MLTKSAIHFRSRASEDRKMVFFLFVFEASFLGDAGGRLVAPTDTVGPPSLENARDPIDGTV